MLFSYELGVLQSGPPVPDAPLTAYANALGTGDRTASITVTSTQAPDQGTLNNLVDGAFTESAADAIDTPGTGATAIAAGFYFRFQFSVKKYIDEFKMYFGTILPSNGQWAIQGSDDATNWTTYATFQWNATGTRTFALTGVPPYGHFYWQWVEDDTGKTWSNTWVTEVEFKIADGAV